MRERETWPIPRLVKLEINWLLNKSPLWDVTVMNEGWMRLGKGVVDFWMETVELNQTWSLRRNLDGLRSENGGAGTEPRSVLRGEPRLRI